MTRKEDITINLTDFKKIKKYLNLEFIVLAIFFVIMIKFVFVFGDGYLNHESPYKLVAGDAFWFTQTADSVSETGGTKYWPAYVENGIENASFERPPFLFLSMAQFSDFVGAKNYDTLIHYALFFIILSIISVYLLLRLFNKNIALLSLPLLLFAFRFPFNTNITWGAHMSNMNLFFIIIGLIIFTFIKEKWMFILFSIIAVAGFMSHGRESVYLGGVIVLYYIYGFIKKRFDMESFKQILLSVPLSLVLIGAYIPYLLSVGKDNIHLTWKTIIFTAPNYPTSSDFGIFKYILILGVVIGLLYLISGKSKNKLEIPILFSFVLIFVSFSNYVLGYTQALQIKVFSPFFYAPLFAVAIYYLISLISKKEETNKVLFPVIVVILILIMLAFYLPQEVPEYAMSNPYTWDSFNWIKENTPENSTLVFLYGDNFYQDTLFLLAKRKGNYVIPEKYVDNVQKGLLTSNFEMKLETMTWEYYIRKGLFYKSIKYNQLFNGSLCDFDYIYFNKLSTYPILQQYTLLVRDTLIKEDNFTLVYENELVNILKNNKVGSKCFENKVLTYAKT